MALVNSFSIGRDTRLVLVGPYGRVDFSLVTGFSSKPIIKRVMVNPIGLIFPISRDIPAGWEFSFSIDRASPVADQLQATMEATFWVGGSVPNSVLYQYITEVDGSVTTWQYVNATIHLSNAGSWKQESAVQQTIDGFAGSRIGVS